VFFHMGVFLKTFLLVLVLCLVNGATADYDACIVNPTTPDCSSYVMPDSVVVPLINALCGMPSMVGCTINKICQQSQYSGSSYCKPFVIYKEMCLDMPMMSNCSAYVSMCNNPNSTVSQCKKTAVIPLPTTKQCSTYVQGICSSMPGMDGCVQCESSCEWLQYYSDLCMSMPDMPQCDSWKTMCDVVPDWPICPAGGEGGPMMRMYFHTGIQEYILFKKWVPTSEGYYVGSWFAVFLFAVFYEVLKLIRTRLEKQWNAQYEALSENIGLINPIESSIFKAQAPFRFGVDFARAFLHFLEVGWGLLIMLVAMTYNVGLFFAVCAGAFVGMLFTGRFMHYVPKASCH